MPGNTFAAYIKFDASSNSNAPNKRLCPSTQQLSTINLGNLACTYSMPSAVGNKKTANLNQISGLSSKSIQ